MVQAILNELTLRKDYLQNERLTTIYFGGGTPSVFCPTQLEQILNQIASNYKLSNELEITLECNPDDLNKAYLSDLKTLKINRLSIGIQSFNDEILKFMNRAHTNRQTERILQEVLDVGFNNITVDLIYGIQNTDLNYWKAQLEKFIEFKLPHLSAYCLTIEPNTYFGKLAKTGKLIDTADHDALTQFQFMMNFMRDKGYEHYEISNFAKDGMISKHNSAYWLGEKYLGIGPSAHSYNGKERSWNVANNHNYIRILKQNEAATETEQLTVANKFNEYILTRLRTKWGIQLNDLADIDASNVISTKAKLDQFVEEKLIIQLDDVYYLTDLGKYQADGISAELFIN